MRARLSPTRVLAGLALALSGGAVVLLRLAGLTEAATGLALILGVAVLSLGLGALLGPRAGRGGSQA